MHAMRTIVLSVSTLGIVIGASAFAAPKSKAMTPNCDINGQKHHYKTKEGCEKKKGKWIDDATAAAAGTAATPAPTATTAAPAGAAGATPAATGSDAKK